MLELEKIYRLSEPFLQGSLEDFLVFLGISKVELLSLDHEDYSNIPIVRERSLTIDIKQCFNTFEYSQLSHIVSWRSLNGDKKMYTGRGSSFEEAALKGLLLYFELNSRKNPENL